nr:YccS family putative transporter [Vibrio eleionomae]
MNNVQISNRLRLYWANKTFNYSALILVTLLGVVIPCWMYSLNTWVTPLILGVIAAALSERDDNFSGRLKAITMTFICFAIASFSIEILFDHPILFSIGLFVSTFGFIMLGAIGSRYASIAFASLLLAVYTMLGADQSTNIWFQPVLLLIGTAWYFFISMLWYSFWPMQPVQQNLANVFLQLGHYLDAKALMFHPTSQFTPQPHRISEAQLNSATVSALNQCKAIFLTRAKRGHVDSASDHYLSIYFLAQDIHERASSTHYRYQELAQHFGRSDILFRFKSLLQAQADACREVAQCIRLGQDYEHQGDSALALDELQQSLDYLKQQQRPEWRSLLAQLGYLFTNLMTVEKQLTNIATPNIDKLEEEVLEDTEPHTIKTMWNRVKSNLNRDSLLFRHALRMSIALTLGYIILQILGLERGYWILLTTLFVCQPNYAATRQKITSRIIGTLAGLLIGVMLLTLFPSQESQLAFIVISGVMFFAFRLNNYGFATGFITVLVLFCFNQLGQGFAVVLPRLADTLIGCALAVGAVAYILPDWHAKRLHKVMADAIVANKEYLDQIIAQYRIGKKDSLSYRIARRNAHNQDAALAAAVNNMLAEPGKYRSATDESFRFVTLNHAMLSYTSALGAHRTRIDSNVHKLVLDSHRVIHQHLDVLYQQLFTHCEQCDTSNIEDAGIEQKLAEWHEDSEGNAHLVLQQLHLIYRMLPELHSLADKFAVRVG